MPLNRTPRGTEPWDDEMWANLTYLDGAAVQKALVTTKGDLLAASGSGTVARLGVGANGQLLKADSAQAQGVKWVDSGNLIGTGSPQDVLTAAPGTIYVDTAKTLGAAQWRKDSGTGNTGWVVTEGDTGRRDISASFTGGWTGYLYIQRKNSVIYITTYNIAAGTGTTLPVPVGFQPNTGADGFAIGGVTWAGTAGVLKYNSSGSTFTASALNDSTAFTIIQPYVTFQAWPSSLPGTAV